jgi:cell cycle arrest protein BUB3
LAQLKTEAPTSISSLAYNANGTQLAVAVSYSWEQGEREHPADSIIIVKVTEGQVKPKEKA